MGSYTIKLKDGRNIGVIEYGDKNGIPVMFFHGTPGSRLMFLDDDETSMRVGIRLISLDRPGFGISDPKPNRTVLDWTEDIKEIADHLDLEKFSVIGVSGGGAYAAACAHQLPDRLHSAALIASIAPFENGKPPKSMMRANKISFFLNKKAPWLMKMGYRAHKKMLETKPEKYMEDTRKGNKHLSEWDRQFLQTDEQIKTIMMHLGEAFRISVDECVNEPVLLSNPWGFSVSDIKVPVDIWHGEGDTMAPFVETKKFAAAFPNSETHFVPKAGHFLSDDEKVWEEILNTITKRVY
ncbi:MULTISPECIES: alpha/beta fold hydrolase [unclassified Bacillus (in: firmicutes)]|uniref:alpha/beta fold hydrolase n=1 Tax=unclassified Bacillus (in: firmicutes) TaxID=185979 RepID=UPI0008EADA9F|nr:MULTISPECIES: alpha/beta hydrolase [unclassified Bacillus (in: firmicutes)]SFB11900.1 Pimeloyl-ACP methyl ester carboxylesterase [Bacillus sp. UNCCL13]SFQ90391.1 Pimeloyl-ACP methyl ester carboxylesterase [Bacillus sp. cl95]